MAWQIVGAATRRLVQEPADDRCVEHLTRVLVLEFGTPGTQTPFAFLDQFYPPAIETKRVDEQKVAALKAKAEAEKAEAEAKAKAAADAEAKAKADAAEGAAV